MGVGGTTPLDPSESEGLIPLITTQQQLDEHELLNIAEALRWIENMPELRSQLPSVKSLKALHRRMFDRTWRWAGQFRTTQKNLGVEAYRIGTELHQLVGDVAAWIGLESYPKFEAAARFHHRLVVIHAFPNGNGRHARVATDLLCEAVGTDVPTWGRSHGNDARQRYLDALRQADGHNIAPLCEFMWN